MSAGALAERFLARAGALGPGPAVRGVRIHQRGRMWTRPGGQPLGFVAVQEIDAGRVPRAGARPMRFIAEQQMDAGRVAFRWRSRTPRTLTARSRSAAPRR